MNIAKRHTQGIDILLHLLAAVDTFCRPKRVPGSTNVFSGMIFNKIGEITIVFLINQLFKTYLIVFQSFCNTLSSVFYHIIVYKVSVYVPATTTITKIHKFTSWPQRRTCLQSDDCSTENIIHYINTIDEMRISSCVYNEYMNSSEGQIETCKYEAW